MTDPAAGTPAPVIKPGEDGPAVGNLIDVLTFWQWLPSTDDARTWEYTAEVEDAVKVAQEQLGVKVTGRWDNATAAAYSELLTVGLAPANDWPPVCSPGDAGPHVEALQLALTAHSLYAGPVNGEYDVLTSVAVQQLQRRAKDVGQQAGPIDGVWNADTRRLAQQYLGDAPT